MLVEIMQRMIGTGQIGGKSLGMLLARAILKHADARWAERLESHDSFYVGSDVFYTYLVQNGCWWLRRRQKDFALGLQRAAEARQKILQGAFPDYIQDQFLEMLEYFGQSPLIVRSSSLLEDNYGNAFSGKYESVFCANQGSPQERLEAFMNAVRTVYASTMSEEGLRYRQHHGLLDRDEQMALLIQRVSGEMYGDLFFPHIAGVGFSFNPFVWHAGHRPTGRHAAAGVRPGHPRRGPHRRRLHPPGRPQRPPQTPRSPPGRMARLRPAACGCARPPGQSPPQPRFHRVAERFPADLIDLFATRDEHAPPRADPRLVPKRRSPACSPSSGS